jgi:hypothetical protein
MIARQAAPAPGGPLDQSTNAPSILAINGFFAGFTTLIILARVYVRAIMLKTVGTDDYLIILATVSSSRMHQFH